MKMKNVYWMMACAAALIGSNVLMSGCYGRVDGAGVDAEDEMTRVTLMLSGNFEVVTGEWDNTRATLADAKMSDLWVYDCDAGSGDLLQRVHLTEGMDAPELLLRNGEHNLSVVASRGTNPTDGDDGIVWEKSHDTFAAVAQVVADGKPATKTVTLGRMAGRMALQVLDHIPADIAELDVTMTKWGTALNAAELSVDALTAYDYVVDATAMGGRDGVTINFYSLAPATPFTADVTFVAKTQEGVVLAEKVVKGVSIKRNATTTVRGNMFSAGSMLQVSVDDAWGEGTTVEF